MKLPCETEQITPGTMRARLLFALMILLCCVGSPPSGNAKAQEIAALSGNGTLSWTNGLVMALTRCSGRRR
jgi:hypothetical protein